MSVFSKKNKTKKTVKEDELFADVQKALAGSPASEEVPILQEAEQALQKKKYLPKITSDLRTTLTPLAVKSSLSPDVKIIYLKIVAEKYRTSSTGTGIGLTFGRIQ
ncbi:bacteriocin immunity protein [Oenococcus oeni]|uniref:bacteriocin immunity protein n=1 Tax=Oenococcus oeni TaxID=1247 RepID=UPI00050DA03C|nr:bacteriocin immunity protein [Oenococcus oeni]KGI02880.1 lactococcin immunity protein [Oenococcus oeni IOEB_C52]